MSRWRLIGLALAAYALALIAAAPATLLDARLAQASSGGLRLAEASVAARARASPRAPPP